MNIQDVIDSHSYVAGRLSVRRPLPDAIGIVIHQIHNFRLSIHFGDRCWLWSARTKAILDEKTAQYWLQHIPVLPQRFHEKLFDEIARGELCSIAIGEDGQGGFRVSVEESERVVLEAHRRWLLTDKLVEHRLIRANRKRDDQTLPARLLRNSFDLYYELGIQEVTLTANYESGGYVWAKFGFMPKLEADWTKLAQQLKLKLSKFKNILDNDIYNYIISKLNNNNPQTIWEISDLNERVNTVKLGQYLLAGTAWKGKISLNDELAIHRFNTYLSQKNLRTLDW